MIWGSTAAVASARKRETAELREPGRKPASRSWHPPGPCASAEVQMFPARKEQNNLNELKPRSHESPERANSLDIGGSVVNSLPAHSITCRLVFSGTLKLKHCCNQEF